MTSIPIDEVQGRLKEMIEKSPPGEEIVITRGLKVIARLTTTTEHSKPPRQLGTLRGSVRSMAPDSDAPLEDFAEYMK